MNRIVKRLAFCALFCETVGELWAREASVVGRVPWTLALGWMAWATMAPAAAKPSSRPTAPTPAVVTVRIESPSTRIAVPSEADRSAAGVLIDKVHGPAPTDAPQRRALAATLLDQANRTTDLPVARYVMLCRGGQLAADTADAAGVMRAADLLGRLYDLDAMAMRTEWLAKVAAIALGADIAPAASACLDAAESAIETADYPVANRLAALAETLGHRGKLMEVISAATAWREEIRLAQLAFDAHQLALATLQLSPDDAPANAAAGRFACLIQGDFDHGVAMLCRGNDARLRSAALADQAAPTTPAEQVLAGNGWWDLSDGAGRVATRHLRDRAAMWYRKARTPLAGLSAALVDQRLAMLDADEAARLRLAPGLSAEIFADATFTTPVARRIDPTIDFNFGDAAPADAAPRDEFSIRWTGLLRVSEPGLHTFVVTANSGVKLTLADQVLLDEPDLSRKRSGLKVAVNLPAGYLPLRLEFLDHGGLARIHLSWIKPGQSALEIVPAGVLWHGR